MIKNVNLDLVRDENSYRLIFEDRDGRKAIVNIANEAVKVVDLDGRILQWAKDQFNKTLENSEIKRTDQIGLLEKHLIFTKTGKWKHGFIYPGCGHDLFDQGLITKDGKITEAGRAALFLLGKGEDPTDSKAVHEFKVK